MDAIITQQASCHELLLPLLEEFKPIRNIQHQIDLVLEAALPNKSAYRMNPMQQADL